MFLQFWKIWTFRFDRCHKSLSVVKRRHTSLEGQKVCQLCYFLQVDQAMATFYKQANPTIFSLAGAGAGGGMAAGLVTFAHGKIVSGM